MALDERLKRDLERAARPADPSGVYDDLIRRRERARIRRRVSAGALGLVVFAGTVAGLWALSRSLEDGGRPAALGPLDGRIVFTRLQPERAVEDATGAWILTSMAPDGSDVREIRVDGVDEVLYPTASPDGTRIAFEGFVAEPESRAVYVVDANGGEPTPIFPLDPDHQVDALAWSPDGSKIAMLDDRLEPTGPDPDTGGPTPSQIKTIWTIEPDGSNPTQVTTAGRETSVAWSPDGERILFARHEPIDPDADEVNSDLFVVNADGTGETRLTDGGDASDGAWSPDGATIVFTTSSASGDGLDLALMDADGTDRRRLTDDLGHEFGAVWSPDGSALAYQELAVEPGRDFSVCHVTTIRSDGSDRNRLTSTEACPATNGLWWSVLPGIPAGETTPTGATGETATATGPTGAEGGIDLGLGSLVCDVTSVRGEFEVGREGTAYVATRMGDGGRCPSPDGAASQVLAVDVSGDGIADVTLEPLVCDPFCTAFAAPDVDGDGQDELLIQNVQFSIAGLKLYEVIGELEIAPITVGGEGSLPFGFDGFEGGAEPQFWLGGDAGNADAIRCEPYEDRRALVSVTSTHPIEGSDPIEVTETTLTLKGSFLSVVDVERFTWPRDDEDRPFLRADGCGASLSAP